MKAQLKAKPIKPQDIRKLEKDFQKGDITLSILLLTLISTNAES